MRFCNENDNMEREGGGINTELAKKVCPRVRDLVLRQQAESRNIGQTFLANSVV